MSDDQKSRWRVRTDEERAAELAEKQAKEQAAFLLKKKEHVKAAADRLSITAVYFDNFPGLMAKIEKETERSIALGVMCGIVPDTHYNYKAFRRSLQIAKDLADPVARANLEFVAHYELQTRIHRAHNIDDAPAWPDWRAYLREQATRLQESAKATADEDSSPPAQPTKRSDKKQESVA